MGQQITGRANSAHFNTTDTGSILEGSIDRRAELGDNEIQLSRRSRLIEWLGDSQVSKELVRRLEEVMTQQKLVRENPDAHWWEYRNKLKKQLQDRPRSAIQQVKAMDEKQTLHPEDIRRRDYFLALGIAARQPVPTRKQIAAVEEFLEPYDPLISYFARQETADMLAGCGEDTALDSRTGCMSSISHRPSTLRFVTSQRPSKPSSITRTPLLTIPSDTTP